MITAGLLYIRRAINLIIIIDAITIIAIILILFAYAAKIIPIALNK